MSNFPAPAAAWREIARLCRRVCVLRERGQIDEAEQVRLGPLATLVSTVSTPADTEAAAARLESVFAQESERVASAAVLAELLLPLLIEQMRSFTAPPVVISNSAPAPPNPTKPVAKRAAVMSIADYIDAMLEQEHPPERSLRVAPRRTP